MARIFIDSTLIDFSRQPTGIPRVVLKFIEEGYVWAARTGHEIIPVVPTTNGLFLCRPVPGASPPAGLLATAAASEEWDRRERQRGIKRLISGGAEGDPPHLIRPTRGDVLFAPSYWHDNDPQIYMDIRSTGCRVAILVHDILPVDFKHFYHQPWRYQFAAAVLQAMGYAAAMYCVSNYTATALKAFAERRDRALPPVRVTHNGFEPLVSADMAARIRSGSLPPHTSDPAALRALGSEEPLLMVGSIEPKKGHIPVIKCLEAMWAAGYERHLVIVGRTGWMERDIVDYIHHSPYFGSRLFWLSGIDDFDLAYAYLRCRALVFASLAEGFGIPMIECAVFGKPVVVLDTPIAREVLGDAACYFTEAASLVRQLMALEEPQIYAAAGDRMADFRWPSWSECVPPVLDELIELSAQISRGAQTAA